MRHEDKAQEMRALLGDDWEIMSGVGPNGSTVCASKHPLSVTWEHGVAVYDVIVELTKLQDGTVVDSAMGPTICDALELLRWSVAEKERRYEQLSVVITGLIERLHEKEAALCT